jgi:Fe-S-cluster containining protein
MTDKQLKNILDNSDFDCQKCSNCCRHEPGAVFLTEEDVSNILVNLMIPLNDFLKKYCRGLFRNGKNVVALKEKLNFDCILWDNGCTIYNARPLQCKTFPFWPILVESKENWENEKYRCQGIGKKGNISLKEKIEFYNSEKKVVYMEMPYIS